MQRDAPWCPWARRQGQLATQRRMRATDPGPWAGREGGDVLPAVGSDSWAPQGQLPRDSLHSTGQEAISFLPAVEKVLTFS